MPRRRQLFVTSFTVVCLSVGAAFAQPNSVTVQPGDTLWGLAQRYGTTVGALRQANGLTGTDLMPGATLQLPQDGNANPDAYVVQPGDTLYNIALAFHLTVDDLIAYNHLDGSVINPGQTLKLKPSTPPPAPLVITVQPGDSLWSVAKDNQVTVAALMQANHVDQGSIIHPGETLKVPGRYAGPSTDTGGPVAPTVTVVKGESLWSIAHDHGTTVAALMGANDLTSTEVFAGQTLRVVPPGQLGPARAVALQPNPPPGTMHWPIHGPITSHFGYRQLRIDGSNFHTGIDIAANSGTPIHAAVGGRVTLAGWNGGYGLCVIITNGNTSYYYGHASVLLVSAGQTVQAGQLIARVGDTGHSTGPHLHFEIRVGNEPVDPLPLLQTQASR
ncbi:MAG TPA: LysM peptidoglycan-binding domain-containing M23 family metallopeptidase [Trueperaceae bacterium]|nr:LysM peptidoglycan-binding domain-containing M23 family metallopeptidase [Trueperaceae bacterium]